MKMLEDLNKATAGWSDVDCYNFVRTHHATIRDMAKQLLEIQAENSMLHARLEAAERDAERYKAVRSGDFGVHARIERGEATEFAYDDDLDQAIDAAMQETGR